MKRGSAFRGGRGGNAGGRTANLFGWPTEKFRGEKIPKPEWTVNAHS